MNKVITAQDVSEARKAGYTSLTLPAGAIVTPQARDDARAYGITLQRGEPFASAVESWRQPPQAVSAPGPCPEIESVRRLVALLRESPGRNAPKAAVSSGSLRTGAHLTEPPLMSACSKVPAPGQDEAWHAAASFTSPTPADSGSLWDAVRAQVTARLGGVIAPAAVDAAIAAVAAEMAREPLPPRPVQASAEMSRADHAARSAIDGVAVVRHGNLPRVPGGAASPGGVTLTDVLAPSGEGPGVGYMEFSTSSFAWTFTTDEVLTVLEGELAVTSQGRVLRAGPGDAVRLASGVSVILSAMSPVRCLYSAWPK